MSDGAYIAILVICGLVAVSAPFIVVFVRLSYKRKVDEAMESLIVRGEEMDVQEFMNITAVSLGGKGSPLYSKYYNCDAIYIIYNPRRKKVFVGRSSKVIDSIRRQLSTSGNAHLFRDYKDGSELKLKIKIYDGDDINKRKREVIDEYLGRGYSKY